MVTFTKMRNTEEEWFIGKFSLDLTEFTVTVNIQVERTCRELGRRQVRDRDEDAINI